MSKRFSKLKCLKARQCGGRCLAPGQICRIDDISSLKIAKNLTKSATKARKGSVGPKIQYITSSEAKLFRAVVASPHSLASMASGARPHPLIKINTFVTSAQVQGGLKKLAQEKDGKLLKKIGNAGIRAQAGQPNLSVGAKRELFVQAYLRQGGLDFYTGKKLNLANVSLDHLTPLSKGGTNSASNLVLTARNINLYKKDWDQAKLQSVLKARTEGLDPSFGRKLSQALASGNKAEVLALQKAGSAELRKKELEADRAQAAAIRNQRATKESLATIFKDGGWLRYNNAGKVQSLPPAALKELLREQKTSAGGVYAWYKPPGGTGSQTYAPKGTAAKAIAVIQSGGSRADLPSDWVGSLKQLVKTNVNKAGASNLAKSLGPEFKDLFE